MDWQSHHYHLDFPTTLQHLIFLLSIQKFLLMFHHCPPICHNFLGGYKLLQLQLQVQCLHTHMNGMNMNNETIYARVLALPLLSIC
jgi:hypothetical protein